MKNLLLGGAFVSEIMHILDTFEIESSIDVIKNNKKVTVIDQRIITDKKTSKTYLVFKEPGEDKYTKIDLLNIIEFLANGFFMALPGENTEKIHFITSYLNTMPKIRKDYEQVNATQDIPVGDLNNEPELEHEPKKKKKKKKKLIVKEESSTSNNTSNEVKNIILSDDDIIDKINGLMNLEEGREFIKKMAGSDNENIFGSIEKLMKTSLGQKCIRKMAQKYMTELKEKIKSCI